MAKHASVISRERADTKLTKKIKILQGWEQDGIPLVTDVDGNQLYKNGVPSFWAYPKSISALMRWKDEKLDISRTSQPAFDRQSEQHEKWKLLLKKLLVKEAEQLASANPSTSKQGLLIIQLEKLVEGQNRTILKQESVISSLEDDVKSASQAAADAESIMHENLIIKDRKIERLEDEIKQLKRNNLRVVTDYEKRK